MARKAALYFGLLLGAIGYVSAFTVDDFLAGTYNHQGTVIRYRLFVPRNYQNTIRYPLVLWLHGAGGRGTDNIVQVNDYSGAMIWVEDTNQVKHPSFVLAPQCSTGLQWVDWPWGKGGYVQSAIPESRDLRAARLLLDSIVKAYSIDSNRLYVCGCSMGGYGTWDIVTRYPGKFAAAIPVCGGGDSSRVRYIRGMGIWGHHGNADGTVPVSATRNMFHALESLGDTVLFTHCNWENCTGKTASQISAALAKHPRYVYSEYNGVDHITWKNAWHEIDGMVDWLYDFSKDTKPVAICGSADQQTDSRFISWTGRNLNVHSATTSPYTVSLFNAQGKIVVTLIGSGRRSISLDKLPPGMYLVNVNSDAGPVRVRLAKN